MSRIPFRYHQIESEGLWISPNFPAAERHHIKQGVIAGFLSGHPRWAEDLDGNFIYGLDAKGKELKSAPKTKTTSAAHTTKKKSPAQLEREINAALNTALRDRPFSVGTVVQFRSEPGTRGIIRSLNQKTARVTTAAKGQNVDRDVPLTELIHARAEHHPRVRNQISQNTFYR